MTTTFSTADLLKKDSDFTLLFWGTQEEQKQRRDLQLIKLGCVLPMGMLGHIDLIRNGSREVQLDSLRQISRFVDLDLPIPAK